MDQCTNAKRTWYLRLQCPRTEADSAVFDCVVVATRRPGEAENLTDTAPSNSAIATMKQYMRVKAWVSSNLDETNSNLARLRKRHAFLSETHAQDVVEPPTSKHLREQLI